MIWALRPLFSSPAKTALPSLPSSTGTSVFQLPGLHPCRVPLLWTLHPSLTPTPTEAFRLRSNVTSSGKLVHTRRANSGSSFVLMLPCPVLWLFDATSSFRMPAPKGRDSALVSTLRCLAWCLIPGRCLVCLRIKRVKGLVGIQNYSIPEYPIWLSFLDGAWKLRKKCLHCSGCHNEMPLTG